jgi:hypothetical protein
MRAGPFGNDEPAPDGVFIARLHERGLPRAHALAGPAKLMRPARDADPARAYDGNLGMSSD